VSTIHTRLYNIYHIIYIYIYIPISTNKHTCTTHTHRLLNRHLYFIDKTQWTNIKNGCASEEITRVSVEVSVCVLQLFSLHTNEGELLYCSYHFSQTLLLCFHFHHQNSSNQYEMQSTTTTTDGDMMIAPRYSVSS